MKYIFKLLIFFLSATLLGQNNLLDTSTWTEGTGGVSGFSQYGWGSPNTNTRENDTDPYGQLSLIWKAKADSTTTSDGGWNTDYHTIDPSKKYRLTVWTKKINSLNGISYFGFSALDASGNDASNKLDDTFASNPYFAASILSIPTLNEWYLFVAYVHPYTYGSTTNEGQLYKADGTLVSTVAVNDFKFASTAVEIRHRVYLRETNPPEEEFFYAPTIYEVNGQEPTIQELLTGGNSSGPGETVWNLNGSGIHYMEGNVGIGITDPGTWKLAVNGKIRATEIKVETGWADYVFEKGYKLPSLEEVEKHILEKGHLINIPSAEEVEANGIELGEMNRLLLEKIEEQMLYLLQLEKRVKELESKP